MINFHFSSIFHILAYIELYMVRILVSRAFRKCNQIFWGPYSAFSGAYFSYICPIYTCIPPANHSGGTRLLPEASLFSLLICSSCEACDWMTSVLNIFLLLELLVVISNFTECIEPWRPPVASFRGYWPGRAWVGNLSPTVFWGRGLSFWGLRIHVRKLTLEGATEGLWDLESSLKVGHGICSVDL